MRVLIIGAGGREHAICRSVKRSPQLSKLFVMPGNAGTAALAENVGGDPTDIRAVVDFAKREAIDLTIVGPEDPLAAGMVDAFEEAGLRIFGPRRAAAQLEADKAFAKTLMRQHAVPTAEARVFEDYGAAKQYIATRDEGLVVKAAGLARGKGAIVCPDPSDAILAAERMLKEGQFGAAGAKIVVEELLEGREVSLLAIVDGRTVYTLEAAQDYKRLGEDDTGPNTGGMGAFCPAPVDEGTLREVEQSVIVPTLDALIRDDIGYRGVLYVGLMLTPAGAKVLEFNCRFGDPETQAVLPRIRSDFLELLDAATTGRLERVQIDWDPRAAVTVVMAAPGYPESYPTGTVIRGLPSEEAEDVMVFHAGTRAERGTVVTSGGRVLSVTGLGEDFEAARAKAYAAVTGIAFEGAQYRRDIAASVAST